MYPEQAYSQQNSLLYWLLDGELGLPGCTAQNEIGRSFKACSKTHIRHVANFMLKPQIGGYCLLRLAWIYCNGAYF